MGTSAPVTTLDIAGGVRVGDQTQVSTCDATLEGTQRYNKTLRRLEYCASVGTPAVYSWQAIGGSGGPTVYTSWATICRTDDTTLYTGTSFASAIAAAGSSGTDLICSSGLTRSYYRVNNALTAYQWEAPMNCSVCATPPGKTCFERWGSNTCPASYSVAYTGHMFQAAWHSGGTSGKIICRAGARVGGIYVANTNTAAVTGYNWIPGETCAVCCSN